MTSFKSLLNSFTSSCNNFRLSLLWKIAVRSSYSTILCHFLFFLTWVRFSFGSHMTLYFSRSLAVFSLSIVTTMLASILETVTVVIRTLSILTFFKALLIVFLYTTELIVVIVFFDTSSSCLSLYVVSEVTFALYFCAFPVTLIHEEEICAAVKFWAAFCAHMRFLFVFCFCTVFITAVLLCFCTWRDRKKSLTSNV